ncbi:sterol desaturase family protein, partial [Francisella tularensis subsp. holarctica]|uniref:sterol desaturase family protein n=1 Tax=Francisella tularensis TaxID=263 RepID=UPI0023AB7E54|nr:sterol desaturase family protein [Francisella tularensis subsp. holarctica]
RLICPTAAVGVAVFCQHDNLGLLNITAIPIWLTVLIAFLVLDFTIYRQHVLFNYLPLLWRFPKVHHSDLEYDMTTGLRFHPVERF